MSNKKEIDWTKPIEQIDGSSARYLDTLQRIVDTKYVVVITNRECENVIIVDNFGSDRIRNTQSRLIGTVWLNIYKISRDGNMVISEAYSTQGDADLSASLDRKACIKIKIDCLEGEGI